jgi:lysophospholipase L1-like esterase
MRSSQFVIPSESLAEDARRTFCAGHRGVCPAVREQPSYSQEILQEPPGRRARRGLPWWKKFVFAVLCVAGFGGLSCYGLEAYYRITLPPVPPNGLQDGVVYTWGQEVHLNRAAFREREFVMAKPPGVFRIVVLGDSLTWGAGLAEEDRYSNRLEARLRALFSGREIEVLNFGLQGASTTVLRDWWMTIKDDVGADLLIVGFCINDPQPRGQDYCPERERFGLILNSIDSMRSIGLRNVAERTKSLIEKGLNTMGHMPLWPEALDRTYQKDSGEWQNFEQALRDIYRTTRAMNLPPPILALLNQGVSTSEPTDYSHPHGLLKTYLRWYDQAREAGRGIGFTVVSFEDLFAERLANQVLAVNPYDGHPSAACNAIYAERLAEIVAPLVRQTLTTRPGNEKD